MDSYAIPLSLTAGAAFYVYVAWIAPDRDDPKNSTKVFRDSIGLLGVSVAFALLLVLPWSIFEGWTLAQVAAADLPYRKMRSTIYVIYATSAAGGIGILHALVARYVVGEHNAPSG
jgi:hypothetical protein